MSLHIELRVEGQQSAIVPLSDVCCVLVANGLAVAVAGVDAAQMNEAINGNLAVVDALSVKYEEASILTTWQARGRIAAEAQHLVNLKKTQITKAQAKAFVDFITKATTK